MPKRAHQSPIAAAPQVQLLATAAGTRRFSERWAARFQPDFFRTTRGGIAASSIALGTYLGESDDATDEMYAEALRVALTSGINVIDTAINYRCQRSERVIGRVLQELMEESRIRRDEVVLCTKAGYIPLDGCPPASREEYDAYVTREYRESGLVSAAELVAGGHCIAPRFLLDQLHRSMSNLGVQGLDCFYVHNPEAQLAAISSRELTARLRLAFETLEACVQRGEITVYGCATWSGLRLPAGSQGHLSLYDMVGAARDVAGEAHHLRVIQLPINLTMSEAVRVSTQRDTRGRLVHVTEAVGELGIDLVASAPLLQGQLTRGLPVQVLELFGSSDAQAAIGFVRAVPKVISVAVGMKSAEHVTENLAALAVTSGG